MDRLRGTELSIGTRAMPEVPTPREFARLLRRMELPDRARVSDLAGKGKLAKDPVEAALVVAAARGAMRGRSTA